MPVKCPSCNLLFGTRNELDWHVREEHTRSRLPPRTPPVGEVPAPTDRPTSAGADGPPLSLAPPESDTIRTAPRGPRAWLGRLLRRPGAAGNPSA
jgi:hypothetical protein